MISCIQFSFNYLWLGEAIWRHYSGSISADSTKPLPEPMLTIVWGDAYWWYVQFGSGNASVLSFTKPSPERMLSKPRDAIYFMKSSPFYWCFTLIHLLRENYMAILTQKFSHSKRWFHLKKLHVKFSEPSLLPLDIFFCVWDFSAYSRKMFSSQGSNIAYKMTCI